ncbi:MAG TPA: hypothetical protein DER02_11400 [Gammaproteobacteria bacterium]|nr:hypothetical protein [Gammaproteobacteria bacterium]
MACDEAKPKHTMTRQATAKAHQIGLTPLLAHQITPFLFIRVSRPARFCAFFVDFLFFSTKA